MRVRTIVFAGAATAGAAAAAYSLAFRPWSRSWGVDPDEAARALPGDDIVPAPTVSDTRGIDIGAPADAVWPWLVQMGYGRAGWYSYDVIDLKGASADTIVPDLQSLAVGDLVPNSPETAFEVRVLEPGRALVLYGDDAMVRQQTSAARARRMAGEAVGVTPANLDAATRLMPDMTDFAASWAFVLEPLADGRTRLIERLRVRLPAAQTPASTVMGEIFVSGVFAMMRKQMLGIRDRAEAGARAG